ncbi:hypothetical protein [Fusobacterium mortiferum]|nr:hypothetical protein [Fusobacterium mortiferum]
MKEKNYLCDYCNSEIIITENIICCSSCGCNYDDVVGLVTCEGDEIDDSD